jgi:hypothetical protein
MLKLIFLCLATALWFNLKWPMNEPAPVFTLLVSNDWQNRDLYLFVPHPEVNHEGVAHIQAPYWSSDPSGQVPSTLATLDYLHLPLPYMTAQGFNALFPEHIFELLSQFYQECEFNARSNEVAHFLDYPLAKIIYFAFEPYANGE